MFGFIKKVLFVAMTVFSFNPLSLNSLECGSMNNQECKIRAKIIDINNNEPLFYPYCIKVNKCSNQTRIYQTRHVEWHETCKCKCRLDSSVCNNKQRWNEYNCRCEYRKELIDKGSCDKGFVWNPSDCNCECDKSCDVKQYLD